MPANKNKLLRMGVIIEMMRKNSFPNFTRFIAEMKRRDPAGAYQLSERTFRRDISDLKAEYGAPIDYDESELGFFLSDHDWFNEKLMVEPFEMRGVLLGQKVAEALMPEPLRSSMGQAVRSLLTRNSAGFGERAELDMMQIINPMQLSLSPELFCTVFNAWERRQKLQLTYCSVKGPPKEMVFEPHVLAWQWGVWYLKGMLCGTPKYAYSKPYSTILAVHRIRQAETLVSSFEGDRRLLDSVKKGKLFEFSRYPEVRLHFLPEVALQVRERFSSQPSCIQESPDGSLVVTVQDLTEYEAVDLVLWARGEVKVLAPEPLRQEILRLTETMRQNQQ
jgi:predicted DNA-binding transcriptional regulator YafY